MDFARYAIYFTPEPGPLADFGAAWLGWDCAAGRAVPHPDLAGLPAPVAELTETPRKYGLHGTIKPPFRLAEATDAASLETATAALCARRASVTLDGLMLSSIGRFLALVPQGDTAGLSDLAAHVVETLDPFRAPPAAAELEKRRKARLSPRQDELLCRWGYPYTHDQFRFHITLTGPLEARAAQAVETALKAPLVPLLPRPFRVDALTLVGEDDQGRFHTITRFALTG